MPYQEVPLLLCGKLLMSSFRGSNRLCQWRSYGYKMEIKKKKKKKKNYGSKKKKIKKKKNMTEKSRCDYDIKKKRNRLNFM